jgi:hypothetical protein
MVVRSRVQTPVVMLVVVAAAAPSGQVEAMAFGKVQSLAATPMLQVPTAMEAPEAERVLLVAPAADMERAEMVQTMELERMPWAEVLP